MVEYIECSNCGKKIEKKNNRTMCIKCTNIRSHILAAQRRATKEYKEYYKEYRANKKESHG